ncbi:aromatic amino acid transport family protein [Candidatus Pantoea edessiphila]|uniref:HAAAP family serine/threonine permease n=1 Tax=Candidatus Pantoea edessiphila TaxID=2044610 RepID=A0A2P5SX43_9GAMM|nr:aromatic amino acid transport family protein [Candidatus Pantoea edessiphila]PPI86906.1 HAAAP family serine/threonine permease [Candidatus Pantoea edessiphila]
MKTTQINTLSTINTVKRGWHKTDTVWLLGLYGTAIGAGVLFLPINAGIGGLIPLIVMAAIAFPLTFFSHRALTRFVLSGNNPLGDITEVVEEHFGTCAGNIMTLFYFLAIYPTLLMYSVAMTNTLNSFIVNQLKLIPPPRVLVSFIFIIFMMTIVRFGEKIILKIMSLLVYPFIIALILISFYLVPHWRGEILDTLNLNENINSNLWITLWLAIPVMVFSFNHSPIISSFALVKRAEYGEYAEKKCSRILIFSNLLMVITVMFFVFSCVFSLSSQDLNMAKKQNITILSYLANHFNVPIIAWIGPPLAIVAITKSFLGHYLGAKEGLNGIVTKLLRNLGKTIAPEKINFCNSLFILITTWLVATLDPNILKMIETLGGPIISVILFIMPIYAIRKISNMHKYCNNISDLFIVFIGFTAISAILYSLFY